MVFNSDRMPVNHPIVIPSILWSSRLPCGGTVALTSLTVSIFYNCLIKSGMSFTRFVCVTSAIYCLRSPDFVSRFKIIWTQPIELKTGLCWDNICLLVTLRVLATDCSRPDRRTPHWFGTAYLQKAKVAASLTCFEFKANSRIAIMKQLIATNWQEHRR